MCERDIGRGRERKGEGGVGGGRWGEGGTDGGTEGVTKGGRDRERKGASSFQQNETGRLSRSPHVGGMAPDKLLKTNSTVTHNKCMSEYHFPTWCLHATMRRAPHACSHTTAKPHGAASSCPLTLPTPIRPSLTSLPATFYPALNLPPLLFTDRRSPCVLPSSAVVLTIIL